MRAETMDRMLTPVICPECFYSRSPLQTTCPLCDQANWVECDSCMTPTHTNRLTKQVENGRVVAVLCPDCLPDGQKHVPLQCQGDLEM